MTRTRYYLGLTTRDDKVVDDWRQANAVELMVHVYGDGCTIYRAAGHWRGTTEETLILEVISGGGVDSEFMASRLGTIMLQDTVLWTAERVEAGFVKVPR